MLETIGTWLWKKVLDQSERSLRKQLKGSEEGKALEKAYTAGVKRLLEYVETEDAEVERVFEQYFQDADVAKGNAEGTMPNRSTGAHARHRPLGVARGDKVGVVR